ncbi:hypothetical protein NPIL_205911 [Nephila pilipes]|uniref:Uncharacterized protein n=1 Tax=Nephila pilipes TaxID=299642 RepID=A0A8X6PGB5_NEPPI|nr:hypothetical protein NPIL_205911 [Nephila pilipes]
MLCMREVRSVAASQHSSNDVFVHPNLQITTRVFVCHDTIQKTLEHPSEIFSVPVIKIMIATPVLPKNSNPVITKYGRRVRLPGPHQVP